MSFNSRFSVPTENHTFASKGLMKFFFLFFISFVACSDFVITLDNFTNLYDRVKRSYFKYEKDGEYWDQFYDSHCHLNNFLVQTYKTEPIRLFRKLEMSQNFQLCFIVVGCIYHKKYCSQLWREHLNARILPKTIAKKFYRWSKEIMHKIVRREDWSSKSKKILKILLSLQKKFLSLLGSGTKKVVERWLAEYKFLYDRFDPSDSNAFLGTFVHLRSIGMQFNGNCHETLSIRKFIKLFKIYRYHFLSYKSKLPWDPSKLDPKFLYFLIFKVKYCYFFYYMKAPPRHPLPFLIDKKVFQKPFKVYKEMAKPKIVNINDAMVNGSSEFIKFVRESIDSNDFDLDDCNHWYLKAILCLIPIYIY
jgi:hypothetical protein